MLTAGDALAKNLAKSQKVIFGSQNLALNADKFGCWRCSDAPNCGNNFMIFNIFFLHLYF